MKLEFRHVDARQKQESECVELRSKIFMINTYLLIMVSLFRFTQIHFAIYSYVVY